MKSQSRRLFANTRKGADGILLVTQHFEDGKSVPPPLSWTCHTWELQFKDREEVGRTDP